MSVRMWTVMPKDHEMNGLAVAERSLAEHPDHELIIVARINRKRFSGDDYTNETTQVARVIHIEVIADAEQAEMVTEVLRAACEARTGQATLPYPGDDD